MRGIYLGRGRGSASFEAVPIIEWCYQISRAHGPTTTTTTTNAPLCSLLASGHPCSNCFHVSSFYANIRNLLWQGTFNSPLPSPWARVQNIPCFKASPLIVQQIAKCPISPIFETDHARHTQVILTTQRLDSPSLHVSYYGDKIDAHCLMLSARS